MYVRTYARRGFTLTEVLFTLTLLLIIAGMSLSALKPAKAKGPTRGLAMALEEELSAARQLAISSGHPVALGMPTKDGPVACSIYRLEGWNRPNLTWVKAFSGDYPGVGFVAGDWGSVSGIPDAPQSSVSKLAGFKLSEWLPSDCENDYIFCFTPEGGLVGKNLKAVNGRYTVVVGSNLQASLGRVTAGNEPMTLCVSPYGGIDLVTGVPSGTLPPGGGPATAISKPAQITDFDDDGGVRISEIKMFPKLDSSGLEGRCVPGQYITLEVYAYDPEGRGLFAKWKQEPNARGIFTYPDGKAASSAPLVSEVERMEYLHEAPDDINWNPSSFKPTGGVFRARWGWTVPFDSKPGDRYEIEVDVKDVKGQCTIVNPPEKIVIEPAPDGKLIVEKQIGGIWQFVQLNPDGSNDRIISPPGVQETNASLDSARTKMAFLQGTGTARYVKIRALDGGYERTVAGPGNYTSVSLSPNGTWISYRRQNGSVNNGTLFTQKVDGTATIGGSVGVPQNFPGFDSTTGTPRSRSGWTPDSNFVIYEDTDSLRWVCLRDGNSGTLLSPVPHGATINEQPYAPTVYDDGSGHERVLFSFGNHDPILSSIPLSRSGNSITEVNPGTPAPLDFDDFSTSTPPYLFVDMSPGVPGAGSGSLDDCYPNISADSRFLILNRTIVDEHIDSTNQTVMLVPRAANGNFVGPATRQLTGAIRRAIWVP